MTLSVEDYLPFLQATGIVGSSTDTGVQIGKAVITPELTWVDAEGITRFSTLPHSTVFSAATYPILATKYPALVTPTLADEPGAPYPYRFIADLT